MRSPIPFLSLVCGAALAASLAGCSSTPTYGGGTGASVDPSTFTNAPAAAGNCKVTIQTWNRNKDAKDRGPATATLVNASSEVGRILTSGRKTSTVVRVLQDDEMGRLLAAIEAQGFATYAREDITLESSAADSRLRGVIVVERDGRSRGFEYIPGEPGNNEFRECRNLIYSMHAMTPGYEARVSTTPADERIFQGERIKR